MGIPITLFIKLGELGINWFIMFFVCFQDCDHMFEVIVEDISFKEKLLIFTIRKDKNCCGLHALIYMTNEIK